MTTHNGLVEHIELDLGHCSVMVGVRRSKRARRLCLRLNPVSGPVVVVPMGLGQGRAEDFLLQNKHWLAERLARLPKRVAFENGALVPIKGQLHLIEHKNSLLIKDEQGKARSGVCSDSGVLRVVCGADHVARRVRDFLKVQAFELIMAQVKIYAAQINRPYGRVSLRDTRSRWGSCSYKGDLSFSWRLVMMPPEVMDYVIAHEVGHLAQLNHSPAFWTVVEGLVGDCRPAKMWLKQYGSGLHLYG